MRDKFEEFVRNNSGEFDFYEPSEQLWQGIENRIKPKKTLNWRLYLYRAAAVILIFGASFLAQRLWNNRTDNTDEATMAEIDAAIPELREAEMYYSGMINAKMEEVKPMLKNYPTLETELESDLSDLDSVYMGLKKDLKDNVANHEVLEAMIENYRLRISILEDMLDFLESQDDEETPNTNVTNM